MTPSRLSVSSPTTESEAPLPEEDAANFVFLSGTQEVNSGTKIPGQPPAPEVETTANGQHAEPQTPRGRGRPRRMDAEKREKILSMLENGFSQSICAAHVGVSHKTLRREMARDAEFRERVMRAETLFEQWPLMTIIRAARNNWRAASWLIANMPHVSVRRRKREEQSKETQPAAPLKGVDPMIAELVQPCIPRLRRGK